MTGSLQVKGKTYYVVVRVPDEFGVAKQKWINTKVPVEGHNKRKAQNEMRRILVELESKKVVYSSKMMFTDWIWVWLEQKKNTVRLNTYESYEEYMRVHIEPYFKKLNLAVEQVTPQHIQNYYNMKYKGMKGENRLSGNSLKKHHVVIHGALKDAVKKNLIAYNPADRVTLPKAESFIANAYTVEESNKLLSCLDKEPIKCAIVLGLFYGLRRSEVCGLRWQDVNFDLGVLTVCNTVVRTMTLIEHEQTKSKRSKRTMLLVAETIPYLKNLQNQQKRNRLLFGEDYFISDHVCCWPDGRPVKPDYVSHAFKNLLKKNELPIVRFHDLRHTAGSILLESGRSIKQIQEYLGHEKAATTLDIYGHLSTDGKKEAARTIDGLLDLKAN